jgi:phage terminase large subunit GpA-like protein
MQVLNKIPSQKNLQEIIRKIQESLKPPPKLSVSEWADSYRYLSPESSAEAGKWNTDKAPFQRGIMDAFSDKRTHTIVVKASAQVGKTEIINNIVGYTVDKDPSPLMVVQPTLNMAHTWSRDRLAPMLRDSPVLAEKMSFNSRDAENSVLKKTYPGGHITVSGSNSPSSLASRPIRMVLLDEVDRYPISAGGEGDPAQLAVKRTTTFWNKKIVYVSTPTIKDESKIDAVYQASDQRVFKVPCPHCAVYQELSFWQITRPHKGAEPYLWFYVCKECGAEIEERYKIKMLGRGIWEAQRPFNGIAGFWIHEVYSPWVRWEDMVADFLEAKKLPDTLKVFINTSLGELWDEEENGEGIKAEGIEARKETYASEVPEGVYIITAAVDVQDDRLEIEFLGWGLDRETWSIDYIVKWGDPGIPDIWLELDEIIEKTFTHSSGMQMQATITCIDAGGHHTESVYKYVKKKAKQRKRVYAVRGHSVRNQPLLAKISKNNAYKVKVHYIGTDTAKEMIYSYLRVAEVGPGYMHHPDKYDAEYFKQLTSEKKKVVYQKGRTVTTWDKPKHKANEALDVKVYNFAAFWILKATNMLTIRKNFEARVDKFKEKQKKSIKEQKVTSRHTSNTDKLESKQRPKKKRTIKKTSYVNNY